MALILSDVVGDPLDIIASGPTVPNRTTPTEVLQIISKYSLQDQLPKSVLSYLKDPSPEYTPSQQQQKVAPVKDHSYSHVQNVIVGSNRFATAAAVGMAEQLGYNSLVWCHRIQGEARLLGEAYAKFAHILVEQQRCNAATESMKKEFALALQDEPFVALMKSVPDLGSDFTSLADQLLNAIPPLCLISAGEPTVNVRGSGKGGRNQELALSFALQIHKLQDEGSSDEDGISQSRPRTSCECLFLSIGTDGEDGPCDAAGAMVDTTTCSDASREGLDARTFLDNNDSYTFFSGVNGGRNLIRTGLTGTNVMDLQILLLK